MITSDTKYPDQPPTQLSIAETGNIPRVTDIMPGKPVKRKTRLERRLILLSSVIATICIALIITLAVILYKAHLGAQVCKTDECVRSAANLMLSMNRSVDPCDDFYYFSCGNWKREHPISDSSNIQNYYFETGEFLVKEVRDFLEQNVTDDEPIPVQQSKILYQACMDTDQLEKLGLEPMFEVLTKVGLEIQPSLQNKNGSDENSDKPVNWIELAVNAKKTMGVDFLFAVGAMPADWNNTVYRLLIAKPNDVPPLPRSFLEKLKKEKDESEEEQEEEEENVLKMYIFKVMLRIYSDNITNSLRKSLWNAAEDIYITSLSLYAIEDEGAKYEMDQEEMTLEELSHLTSFNGTSQVNWTEYFSLLMENTNVTFDVNTDKILVMHKEYFQLLSAFLSNTTKKSLELALWWHMVEMMVPYTDSKMRELSQEYSIKGLGIRAPQSRSIFCTTAVKSIMKIALGYFFADEDFFDTTYKQVEHMIKNIQSSFSTMVKSVSWLDTKTKEATLEKVDAVRLNIGFPNWILDKEALEEYYEDIDINGTNFLSDMVNVLGAFALLDLEYVGTEVDFNDTMDDPLDVNAYYVPQQNSIQIPAGILQFPFYDLGLEALNYGNLGCTLGHELTHGFDNSGRKFDKVGNLRQWWSNATVDEYVKRTKCFIHQFDTYKLDILKVNGTKTLPENLADDGGLRAAFMAYQNVLKHKTEDKLIGFEDFTQEQLFFLSYANSWCEAWTESYLHSIKGDEHAPNYYRLIGSLANNADFARTFNCPKGSRMNPKQEKCQIW